MTAMQAIDHVEAGSTVPAQGPCPRATGKNPMNLLSQDLSRERIPGVEARPSGYGEQAELAQRVRALRRARRDARTRAARVRRALLAPTPTSAATVPYPTRHAR
jgi:hypothetical protein